MATSNTKKTNQNPNKFVKFLKTNIALIIIAVCVLAIAGIIIAETVSNNTPAKKIPVTEGIGIIKQPDTPDPPGPVGPIWTVPVASGDYTLGLDFSLEEYAKSSTFGYWFFHKGIDFLTEDGVSVMAAFDGVVESITNTVTDGTTVTINHGSGLKTVYSSLSDDVNVAVGQTVKSGDTLGYSSSSASDEFMDGAHVHFEVKLNGAQVNPWDYLPAE